MFFYQSDSTAARRRFPLYLVGPDGITPATGEAGGQPQVSKNGGAWVATTNLLAAVGNGSYTVELTTAELDTLGRIQVRYKSANTVEFSAPGDVLAVNPYDAVRGGLTALPSAAAQGAGGLLTSGTGAHQLSTTGGQVIANSVSNEVSITQLAADKVWQTSTRSLTTFGTLVSDIWSNTTRTLSAFAFGVTVTTNNDKAGYSLSAAGVQAVWDALESALTTVGSIGKKLADWALGTDGRALVSADAHTSGQTVAAVTGSVGSVAGNVAGSVASVTGAVGSVTGSIGGSITGNVAGSVGSLSAQAKADVNAEVVDVLDTDTLPELPLGQPPKNPTHRQAVMLHYMQARNRSQQTANEARVLNDAGTVIAKQAVSTDGTTYTREKMASGA